MSCTKCNESVTALPDSIACRNSSCNALYHARCVGIPRNLLKLITKNKYVFFYCDACSADPFKVQVTPTVTISDQILSNQSSVTGDNISEQLVCIQDSVMIHTPQRKTAKKDPIVVGSAVENSGLRVAKPRKFLVASLFHPSTDPENLSNFLKEKLSVASESTVVRVHKLVPAGKDLATLDYVSFKVVVPGDLFTVLLSPSIWPKGVHVREFVHRSRKSRADAVFLPLAITYPDAETQAM